MECFLASKWKGVLTHVTRFLNPEDMTLSKIRGSQKDKQILGDLI
jgi:hypothetical protein